MGEIPEAVRGYVEQAIFMARADATQARADLQEACRLLRELLDEIDDPHACNQAAMDARAFLSRVGDTNDG